MIEIKGYKNYVYRDFQSQLHKNFVDSEKSSLQIALEIEVQSSNTVQNAFNIQRQTVSDQVMTNVMKAVGLSGFVVWIFGKRYYYIKNK